METNKLKKFAQHARRLLLEQVAAKLALVLDASSAARRESPQAVAQLEKQMAAASREQLIDKVAYTWFNRFCALRFMDVNSYTRIRVVSPADEGQFQPEILAEAKAGHIDHERVPEKVRQQIQALLSGNAPSHDPQQEAYRLLVVAECNAFHIAMPYLFERIADFTELLMPDDLLSGNSILDYTREAMTADACQDVEVIGWLYQFYISEKKDTVFEGLKKNQKITAENIPAATQLFTPHWIVRYLVENSLGRLWMLNHPNSGLSVQMDYYIKPEVPETDFLKIARPEDIKVCDPACGSGHMLTYAFDLLYAIYEEVGTEPSEIPEKILTFNLYGIELDERAGELAAFALTMKARAKQRRFFNKAIKPNIAVLEKVKFSSDELDDYVAVVGDDLFTFDLRETLKQFEEAENFGSLIRPKLSNVRNLLPVLESKDMVGNLFLASTHNKVLQVLRMVEYLSPRYQVVVANPPYMGAGGMNARLSKWGAENYSSAKYDLFAMFIFRSIELLVKKGYCSMVTMQNWMFLSRYERFRIDLMDRSTVACLVQIGFNSFPELNSKVALASAFVLINDSVAGHCADYTDLNQAPHSSDKNLVFLSRVDRKDYRVSSDDIKSIPGYAVAYSASPGLIESFKSNPKLGEFVSIREGMATGCNELFLRNWSELSFSSIFFDADSGLSSQNKGGTWFPYIKGGGFRRWGGNFEFVVDWGDEGERVRSLADPDTGRIRSHNYNGEYAFREGFTWTGIGIDFGVRKVPSGFMFDAKGPMGFSSGIDYSVIGLLNSALSKKVISLLAPTLDFKIGHVLNIPYSSSVSGLLDASSLECVGISQDDWDAKETSWGFKGNPLIISMVNGGRVKSSYYNLREMQQYKVARMRELEEYNNKVVLEVYGLADEVSSSVDVSEITLHCNPFYSFGREKTAGELDTLQLGETVRELLSYSVACMFGRYSLDKPGLVLANQGETLADYLRQIPEPCFMPDEDNVIPLLDGDWFADDITERFRTFLRVSFGEEHYEENLAFIEVSLGKDVRKYFIKDFYTDHVKRYKKRPIYWLFASPKGTFSALIYLHRYRTDTVSVVLQYLRDFRKKLAARLDYLQQVGISTSVSQGEKTRALKEIETLKKQLLELDDYERETLYPLATEQVPLDLDDGVKVNYLKLGSALKKISGLDAKED